MEENQVITSQIATVNNQSRQVSIYTNDNAFEQAQRICKMLASSTLVPTAYQGNVANTMIAYEFAQRTGTSPLMVMQNLDIIHGRPAWRGQFTAALVNSCGRFTELEYRVTVKGVIQINGVNIENRECVAYATSLRTGKIVEGPPVSIQTAINEGWYSKKDKYGKETSKWQTMPELMLHYRAAAFFGRIHCPDVLQGLHSSEEIIDIDHLPIGSHLGSGAQSSGVPTNQSPIGALNASVQSDQASESMANDAKQSATINDSDNEEII